MSSIESKVADTILQKPFKVKIGNETYKVQPPTVGTMILVSEAIAKLPKVAESTDDIISESLRFAKDSSALGDIFAIFILGAKNVIQKQTIIERKWFGLFKTKRVIEVDKKAELAKTLLESASPKELHTALITILSKFDVADFFAVSISLTRINLTATREIETIASGQSSRQL